jgi:hypothetical protein
LPNCWRPFFLVLPKLDGFQIDLPNCWSCSNVPNTQMVNTRSRSRVDQPAVNRQGRSNRSSPAPQLGQMDQAM